MKKKGMLSNCLFIIKVSFSLNPAVFWLYIPLILLKAASIYLPILFVRLLLNAITDGDAGKCLQYVLLLTSSVAFCNILIHVLEIYAETQMEITLKKMNNCLGEAIMRMPYSEVEQPKIRDFILLAQEGSNLADLFKGLYNFLTQIITVAGLTCIILNVQPVIFLLVAIVVVVRMWSDGRNRKLWNKWRPLYAPIMRKVNYFFYIMKSKDYGKEIRLYHLSDWIYQKVLDHTGSYMEASTRHNVELQRNNVLSEITIVLEELVVYLILAYRVVFAGMPIGDFSMYMTSIRAFSDGVRGIVNSVASLLEYNLFAGNLRYCLEAGKNGTGVNANLIQSTPGKRAEEPLCLEFRHVSFSYPDTDHMVLNDVSLTLRAGESLSIVGANGAGKTTFVKLLCRLYEPSLGKILLNGVEISSVPYGDYVRMLGVVFQDFRLFAFSMEENITMGLPPSGSSITECVEESGLADRLRSLPRGLKTNLSKEFDENGIEISGGEGQKLALARVLYKNPAILVLDEPASALDPLAEYEMYKRFHEIVDGKCAVYISHRLSSTRFTDKIAVFEKGHIAEYGSHQELMADTEGIYSEMFRVQAGYYK